MAKQVKLQNDEFHPRKLQGQFWMLPQGIASEENLSPGAKTLYSVLFGLAGKHGTAFARQDTLGSYIGKCTRTVNRYQNELVNAGLIRVLQKGRGLPNNYYLLRHPALGNAAEGEFEVGARHLYRDRSSNTQTLVTEDEGVSMYEAKLKEWYEVNSNGGFSVMPQPGIKMNPEKKKELVVKWGTRLAETIAANEFNVVDFINETNSGSTKDTIDYDMIFGVQSTSGEQEPKMV